MRERDRDTVSPELQATQQDLQLCCFAVTSGASTGTVSGPLGIPSKGH
jgi:hypothetical protein